MRVLLVDDHLDGLEITAKLLRMEGFEVFTAGCCKDAVSLARESHMDLVVTDLGLPDGTGMELLADLKRIYPIEGVAMTAHSEGWYLEGATSGAFVRYLIKPFVFSDLLVAVRGALESGRQPSSPGRASQEPGRASAG
jgi:DNA-binding response OmpR family regulator